MKHQEGYNEEKIPEFDEVGLRKIAKEIILQRFFLIVHCLVYVFVNLLLFVINFLTNWSYPWFLWAVTGWGVVFTTHGFYYVLYKKGVVNISSLGILYDLWGFFIVNLFLLFVNLFTNVPMWTLHPWFWFPLASWGAILIIHAVIYFYIVPSKEDSPEKNWLERKIDKELQKIQRNTERISKQSP